MSNTTPTLKASLRDAKKGAVSRIRTSGGIPAVLYGHKIKNANLALDAKEFGLVYKTAGESSVLKLEVEGEKSPRNVLIHDTALDPVQGSVAHVDLYEVRMDEKIRTGIHLAFEGESAAVKSEGGGLVKNIYEIEVEALPADLPHEIKVDISKLVTFQDAITLADLPISSKVKVFGDPKEIIAKVAPPRTQEELEALKEEVVAKVEDVKVETEEKKKEREAAKEKEKETEKAAE